MLGNESRSGREMEHSMPMPFCCDDESPSWFAAYTMPHSEQAVCRMLDVRQVESFLPTVETSRIWKNRQRVKVQAPLFPSYLFVRIHSRRRGVVLSAPGVLHIIGNAAGPIAIPDREIDFLRSDFCKRGVEPYHDLVIGNKVRIRSGPMEGLEGTLVQRKKSLRFVLTIAMINQSAAVEVQANDLEAVPY
jgi:transcription antitermination factor NusG